MIELLCTIAGVIAGIVIVASFMNHHGDSSRFQVDKEGVIDAQRIQGIAEQLKIITTRVADNVTAHSQRVNDFGERLDAPRKAGTEQLVTAIDDIIKANGKMQSQLAEAQKRIAQQSEMIEQASHQARTDALTGLANRRALDEYLDNCIATLADDQAAGLLLLDIDHFKSFNDSFGHSTGDAVLAEFARSINKCCGTQCYTARYGGEEFAIVLTGENMEELSQRAAAIRRYISERVITYEDLQLKITSSAGLCKVLAGDELTSAYERADDGLYQAKKAGRNCGKWLSEEGWEKFPEVEGNLLEIAVHGLTPANEGEDDELRATAEIVRPNKSKPTTHSDSTSADNSNAPPAGRNNNSTSADAPHGDRVSGDLEEKSTSEASVSDNRDSETHDSETATAGEIIELPAFLERLEPYLAQLKRAEFPSTAIMMEAIGLGEPGDAGAQAGWKATIALAQLSFRGIDIACQFRRNTLCVFLPGCSQDAAIDRVAKIQANLASSRDGWEDGNCPERLACAVAALKSEEECSQFLDRLEMALDEAQDAAASQVVIHNGEGCHFQEIV